MTTPSSSAGWRKWSRTRGYSLVALGGAAGLPEQAAEGLPWLVGVTLLVATFVLAGRDDGERVAFSVATVAALVITPIVWIHYFALLVMPLALARPRLGWAWGLMWVFWITPGQETHDHLWRIIVGTAVVLAVLAVSATTRRQTDNRAMSSPAAAEAGRGLLRQPGRAARARRRDRVVHPALLAGVPWCRPRRGLVGGRRGRRWLSLRSPSPRWRRCTSDRRCAGVRSHGRPRFRRRVSARWW